MKCPYCLIEMEAVRVETHYGRFLALDQCKKCGGLWFDKFELYEAKQGEAEKLEKIDVAKLAKNNQLKAKDIFCPRDQTKLTLFKDPNFPQSIQIEGCHTCGGFWFNRGEFVQYQKERQKKLGEKEKEDTKLEKQIDKLLALEGQGGDYSTLGKMGKVLMTPMYGDSGIPLPTMDKEIEQEASQTAGIIAGVIRLLLEIIARFIA